MCGADLSDLDDESLQKKKDRAIGSSSKDDSKKETES
jgi:hypothetical protein